MSHKSFRDALKEIVKTKHILIWLSIDIVELAAKRRKRWDETIWNENANITSVFIPGKSYNQSRDIWEKMRNSPGSFETTIDL